MTAFEFISIAAFGAVIQEIIHLYDIRNTLHLSDTTSILKAWQYWAVTLAMIIVSGVGTWILYGGSLTIKSVILILGAAFPLLFKKLVASAGAGQGPNPTYQPQGGDTGPHLGSKFTLQDYFK